MATRESLAIRSRKDPVNEREEILDPGCGTERWWALASIYPIAAIESVLYPLLTLEAPERWERLQRENIEDWILTAIDHLPEQKKQLFAADCAERVLHLYERECPGDTRVREVIEARRRYALGLTSKEDWVRALWGAESALDAASNVSYDVAHAASISAGAAFWAVEAIRTTMPSYAAFIFAKQTEHVWQFKRALQYLHGKA